MRIFSISTFLLLTLIPWKFLEVAVTKSNVVAEQLKILYETVKSPLFPNYKVYSQKRSAFAPVFNLKSDVFEVPRNEKYYKILIHLKQ